MRCRAVAALLVLAALGRAAASRPIRPIRNPQSAVGNPQSAIRNPQSAIRNPQSDGRLFTIDVSAADARGRRGRGSEVR